MKKFVKDFFPVEREELFLVGWYRKIIFFEWVAVFGISSWLAVVVATILH